MNERKSVDELDAVIASLVPQQETSQNPSI